MPRKKQPSFELKQIIWDLAACDENRNYELIVRSIDKAKADKGLSEDTPDVRTVKRIVEKDINQLNSEVVSAKLPRHVWHLRSDYEQLCKVAGKPVTLETNWIDAYKAKTGEYPVLPDYLLGVVNDNEKGKPISKQAQPITPAGQWWDARVPSEQKQWRELVVWLGKDPEDLLAQMRMMLPNSPTKQTPPPQLPKVAISHDKTIFRKSDAIMSERDVRSFTGDISNGHAIRESREIYDNVLKFNWFFSYESNKYVSPELEDSRMHLTECLVPLVDFISQHFFSHGSSVWSTQLGSVDERTDLSKYTKLVSRLYELTDKTFEAYKSYRATVRKTLIL